jgi:hypothetical protein
MPISIIGRRVRISPVNVRHVQLDQLEPGDVVPEGVVLDTSVLYRTFTTPAGTFDVPHPDDTIAVLATIEPDMLTVLVEHLEDAPPKRRIAGVI